MKINDADLRFARMPGYRTSNTELILHHAAWSTASVQDVHKAHQEGNGWAGIGYHYYVRKDGSIWLGRYEDWLGGHTWERGNAIGVCFEGNFENETMGKAQQQAGRELVAHILSRYPGMKVYKHSAFNATACPGANFPFDEMTRKDNDEMTQEQFNEMYRAMIAEKKGNNPSTWAEQKEAVEWAKKEGIFIGDGKGNFNWQDPITREAIALVLYRQSKKK